MLRIKSPVWFFFYRSLAQVIWIVTTFGKDYFSFDISRQWTSMQWASVHVFNESHELYPSLKTSRQNEYLCCYCACCGDTSCLLPSVPVMVCSILSGDFPLSARHCYFIARWWSNTALWLCDHECISDSRDNLKISNYSMRYGFLNEWYLNYCNKLWLLKFNIIIKNTIKHSLLIAVVSN